MGSEMGSERKQRSKPKQMKKVDLKAAKMRARMVENRANGGMAEACLTF